VAESSLILAMDPGANAGFALGQNGRLIWAGLNELPGLLILPGAKYSVFWEKPEIYPGTKKENPNDLITEAVTAGRWLERIALRYGPPAREWWAFPREWKGGVPKDIHNDRVLERLNVLERPAVPKLPKSKLHNVVDAIGLLLVAQGRMDRGR
jgi:hypothetical protein